MNPSLNYLKAFAHVSFEQLKDRVHNKNTPTLSKQEKEVVEEIKANGVSVVENYFSKEKCDQIIGEIDRMIEEEQANIWKDKWGADTRIYAAHQHSELIKEFHHDPFLKRIGETYVNSPILNSHTLGARLIPKESNPGSGGGWHRDSVYKIQYKSIAYLTDVNEDNGPFEYLLGTQNKKSIYQSILKNHYNAHQNRMTASQIKDFLETNKQYQSKIFTAKKGSLILVDTSGIHRGMPIRSGKRYALTNYFFPKHHYTKSIENKFKKLF